MYETNDAPHEDGAQRAPRHGFFPAFGEGEQVLERERRLSESVLFEAQRAYFARTGIDAWRTNTVPHYITNNPALAARTAQVVLGYLRDGLAASGDADAPFTLVELGAGSGRFAYLFLRAFLELRARSSVRDVAFRYVMTDVTPSNLDFWRSHPLLAPFVAAGQLDFALFDVERPGPLVLLESGVTLGPGALERPLAVIANYVFDGVSHDAFVVEDGRARELLVSVTSDSPDLRVEDEDAIARLRLSWTRGDVVERYYDDPAFDAILGEYAGSLGNTTLTFPATALRCVAWLAALAQGRLLLVSSDRGSARAEALEDHDELELAIHGSFSLTVNHHAFCRWVEGRGGVALTGSDHAKSLDVVALVLGPGSGPHSETRLAYHLAFEAPGVDDFFRLRQGIQDNYSALSFDQLLSVVRLSRFDPRILLDALPAIAQYVEAISPVQRRELLQLVRRTYDNYFPIGEARDAAFELGIFLYQLGEPAEAAFYFEASERVAGADPRTSWNLAACLFAIGRGEEGARLLAGVHEAHPGFGLRLGLLSKT